MQIPYHLSSPVRTYIAYVHKFFYFLDTGTQLWDTRSVLITVNQLQVFDMPVTLLSTTNRRGAISSGRHPMINIYTYPFQNSL